MMQDFRFAFRQLWKAPAFTIAAVTVLALGIGVNTAIFSLVNVMLFQPPNYALPAEIVQLFSQDKKDPKSFRGFSYPTYRDVREQNTVFSGLVALSYVLLPAFRATGIWRLPAWVPWIEYGGALVTALVAGRIAMRAARERAATSDQARRVAWVSERPPT